MAETRPGALREACGDVRPLSKDAVEVLQKRRGEQQEDRLSGLLDLRVYGEMGIYGRSLTVLGSKRGVGIDSNTGYEIPVLLCFWMPIRRWIAFR
jgi:hypothetical protein